MSLRLGHIGIANFRSIGRQIEVPLAANTILIHGSNGVGKTTILSALELALTGSIDSLERADSQYMGHLVHEGVDRADIELAVRGARTTRTKLSIEDGQLVGRSRLTGDDARYFGERAYLAQTAVSRLLELYNRSDANGESALTKFVNDLLGLDYLESTIAGLAPALDIRRTRKLVPAIEEAERRQASLISERAQIRRSRDAADREIREAIANLRAIFVGREARAVNLNDDDSLLVVAREFAAEPDNPVEVSPSVVAELRALLDKSGLDVQDAADRDLLSSRESELSAQVADWHGSAGQALRNLYAEIDARWKVARPSVSMGQTEALEFERTAVKQEIDRLERVIANNTALQRRAREGELEVERTAKNLALVTSSARQSLVNSDNEAHLALLIQASDLVADNVCPICGRDYSEISDQTLASQIDSRIAAFEAVAAQLRAQNENLREGERAVQKALETVGSIRVGELSADRVLEMSVLADDLRQHLAQLNEFVPSVCEGDRLIAVLAEVRAELVERAAASSESEAVLARLGELGELLSVPKGDTTIQVWISALINTAESFVNAREDLSRARLRARDLIESWTSATGRSDNLVKNATALETDLVEIQRSTATLNSRIAAARRLSRAAVETRSAIVKSVFDRALNQTWADLFTRLAPNEAFTPAFATPRANRARVSTRLTTTHRTGGVDKGSPGAVLSAGNLNTAALTLFLALNLTAESRLPWLILDDPIQSMDDVHIAQFAGLLKTFSKDLGKQTVVAVHEKALFDYLALELSPSYPGDTLTLVTLVRDDDGNTNAESTTHEWDQALARLG